MADAKTVDRWFLSDCEGSLEIWREAVLRNVTRDENGEVDSYRLPAAYKDGDLIASWDLSTWDEGEDPADDARRSLYAEIVRAHNAGDEVRQLRTERNEARKGKVEQMLGRLDDWSGDLAAVVSDRDSLSAQRDAVLMLIGEAHSLAAADIQAGGPPSQLDALSVPVHDLLVALGVLTEDGAGRAEQAPGDQERRDLAAATIAAFRARRMVVCEHTQLIEYGGCADAVLAALARWDAGAAERLGAELATAQRLLSSGLNLRMYGENAPGSTDTWRAWDTRTEEWLRRDERLDEREVDRG